jgi:reactive chlorine resistance protein C
MREAMVRTANRVGGHALEILGMFVTRYGLVAILLWLGALKFTEHGAASIEPFVSYSPVTSWAYHTLGARTLAGTIGGIEIAIGLMIAVRPVNARVSASGGLLAAVLFLVSLSFLFTTPGVWQPGYGVPSLSNMPGQFLLKDVLLLGAAIWTGGEALAHARARARVVVERRETRHNEVVVE